jgi:hypothetical protein
LPASTETVLELVFAAFDVFELKFELTAVFCGEFNGVVWHPIVKTAIAAANAATKWRLEDVLNCFIIANYEQSMCLIWS